MSHQLASAGRRAAMIEHTTLTHYYFSQTARLFAEGGLANLSKFCWLHRKAGCIAPEPRN
jgi:hypothetical protein